MKLKITVIVLLAAVVLSLHIVRRNSSPRGMQTTVNIGNGYELMSQKEADSLLFVRFPDLMETKIKNIELQAIKDYLESNPYIQSADVDITTGGKLVIEIKQNIPVARMFYQGNEFYLSHQNTIMPLSEKHYCNLIVGSCEVERANLEVDTNNYKIQIPELSKIRALTAFLHDNSKYGDLFDQVIIDSTGDLILVPKLGDLTVVVGDTTRLDTKFKNLGVFFSQGINQVGWDSYSTINLKYKNQVVCTRRKN